MKARNFRAMKLGWDPFGQQSLAEDEKLVALARQAAGDETTLLIDAGGSNPYWTNRFKDALARAKMLADYNVYWYEEPLPPDDLEGYARLVDLSPVKIAHGEVLTRRQSFVPFFQRRAMDIVQPDATKCGGLSELRRIAWRAEEHGIEVVPHGWNTGLGVATDLHFVSTLHTVSFVEFNVGNPMVEEIIAPTFALDENGCLAVPEGPGLGVEIDVARLTRFAEEGYSAASWTWEEEKQFELE
jgi:D-galactarolactone cycloisomerase